MKKWRERDREREGGKRIERERDLEILWREEGRWKGTAVNVGASDTHLCVRQVGEEGGTEGERRDRSGDNDINFERLWRLSLSLPFSPFFGQLGAKRGILPPYLSSPTRHHPHRVRET